MPQMRTLPPGACACWRDVSLIPIVEREIEHEAEMVVGVTFRRLL